MSTTGVLIYRYKILVMVGENKPLDDLFMIWPPTRQDMQTIWVVSLVMSKNSALSRHVPTNFQCYAALKDGINVFPCISHVFPMSQAAVAKIIREGAGYATRCRFC